MKNIEELEKEIASGKLPEAILTKRKFQLNQLKHNLQQNNQYEGYLKYYDGELHVKVTPVANMYELVVLAEKKDRTSNQYPYINNNFRLK